ncbi:MAG: hypothetical protein AAGD18_13565 [Actinomycetota bacterium]
MRIVGYVPDLMDRSRWSAVAHVAEPADLAGAEADLVVVDLDRLPTLDLLADIGAPTLGFCSHVHDELRDAALAAGCDEVVPRSRMARVLTDRLTGAEDVRRPDETGPTPETGR